MGELDRSHSLETEKVSAAGACLTLAGEWDLSNAERITHAVAEVVEAGRVSIALDLRRVTFLDSTALSYLLLIQKQAEASGWHVVVVPPEDKRVWRLFELTALTARFDFVESRTAALIRLGQAVLGSVDGRVDAMDFTVEAKGDGAQFVCLGGELDMASAPELKDRLGAILGESNQLVVDLSRVDFLDSSILGVLVSCQRRAEAGGGQIALVGLQPNVRKVFDITGLTGVFAIYETIEHVPASIR